MAKAQVQMGETIAILVVFFFLIVIGLVFYVNIAKTKLASDKEENEQLDTINVVKRVLSLPEVQCSRQNIAEESCMDSLKLAAAQDTIPLQSESYFDFFGYSKITITQIYPAASSYTLYDRSLPNPLSKSVTNTPISLYNPLDDTKSFALVSITTTYPK